MVGLVGHPLLICPGFGSARRYGPFKFCCRLTATPLKTVSTGKKGKQGKGKDSFLFPVAFPVHPISMDISDITDDGPTCPQGSTLGGLLCQRVQVTQAEPDLEVRGICWG